MKTLNPYLNFSGRCQDALNFYEKIFNGKTVLRQTFGQSPNPVAGVNPALIMHAEFQAEGIYFMATDGMGNDTPVDSSKVTLNIGFSDTEEQLSVFNGLAEQGDIIMPLSDTFWGAKFGMVKDPFGIHWMLNCQQKKG